MSAGVWQCLGAFEEMFGGVWGCVLGCLGICGRVFGRVYECLGMSGSCLAIRFAKPLRDALSKPPRDPLYDPPTTQQSSYRASRNPLLDTPCVRFRGTPHKPKPKAASCFFIYSALCGPPHDLFLYPRAPHLTPHPSLISHAIHLVTHFGTFLAA